MSRLIVNFLVGFINVILVVVYIAGVIVCFENIPNHYFGVFFKWVVSFILPFLIEILLFGPLLIILDMRNSLRTIEYTLIEMRSSNTINDSKQNEGTVAASQ